MEVLYLPADASHDAVRAVSALDNPNLTLRVLPRRLPGPLIGLALSLFLIGVAEIFIWRRKRLLRHGREGAATVLAVELTGRSWMNIVRIALQAASERYVPPVHTYDVRYAFLLDGVRHERTAHVSEKGAGGLEVGSRLTLLLPPQGFEDHMLWRQIRPWARVPHGSRMADTRRTNARVEPL